MSDSAGTATGLGSADGPRGGSDGVPVRERRPGRLRTRIGGVATYYKQVVAELRKVIWPTRRDLVTYTAVVLVFVLFMVAVVSLFDFAAAQGVLKVFGEG